MDNYPDYTWAGDPYAPWNRPDPDEEEEYFVEEEIYEGRSMGEIYEELLKKTGGGFVDGD